MPSITAYSPYETLAFFQSIIRHGADASALQSISTSLKQNETIRDNATFDATRFSADALRHLYNEYVSDEKTKSPKFANGESNSGERSPKRRKLSSSTQSQDNTVSENEQWARDLVDRLYSTYKETATCEIKKDEEAFTKLQDEISQLEKQIELEDQKQALSRIPQPIVSQVESNGTVVEKQKGPKPAAMPQLPPRIPQHVHDSNSPTLTPAASNESVNITIPDLQRQGTKSPLPRDSIIPRPPSSIPQTRVSQPPAPPSNPQPSPGAFPRQLPSPSAQRPNYGPIQTQPAYPPAQAPGPNHAMPQVVGAPPRPLPRGQHAGNQSRGSPMPYQGQHPYPAYPQYPPPPPPQWHPHMSPQQYQQHTPYGPAPQYYPQLTGGRHPQTPQQIPYPTYPHTAPMPYMQQQQQQQWRGQPWPVHSASSITTPVSRPDSRLSVQGSGSSTPWKRKQQSSQVRTRSPPPPEREVSPLTDRETSPVPMQPIQERKIQHVRKREDETPSHKPYEHQGRPQSVTPSADGPSRSQSRASRASDIQYERHRRGQLIKAEPPSTPLPVASSDNEQRSSGRRGRPRSSTITSQADGVRTTIPKRKRDSHSPASPVRSPRPPFATPSSRRLNQTYDPSLVVISKNFAKTSQLLLSEITSHKLAGIFAKPLSERDAPGYKDVILRPQDLKSIKAAVSKGGRAALAAIEAMEGEYEATPTRLQPSAGASSTGPIGKGFYLVPKSADLIPPKGIVNSAQLEMELVRMFANAIMFNPLSSSERGFGRGLRLRRNGGDVDVNPDPEDVSSSGESESGNSSVADEDGIIADAREMFNDVVETVGKWRELEGERMGTGADTSASRHGSLAIPVASTMESGRQASVSASSNVGDEDTAAGESEAASTPVPAVSSGPGRKRRRLTEH